MRLELAVTDKNGYVFAQSEGEDFASLVIESEYSEGDRIVLRSSEKDVFIKWQVDDGIAPSEVYITENEVDYIIPFGEKRDSMSPKAFTGAYHLIYVQSVAKENGSAYRNLALNTVDQHREVSIFPHASANVETRGESVFAAKNAIDGVYANEGHGSWPYASWGINRQDDAAFKLEFGRKVRIDKLVLVLRSDFPHDNCWKQVHFSFSDGSEETFDLEKSVKPHVLPIREREVEWLVFDRLIKFEGPSPFPALTQMEVWGRDV